MELIGFWHRMATGKREDGAPAAEPVVHNMSPDEMKALAAAFGKVR